MAVFLPLYCGHRSSPCLRRPLVHLGPITRTYHGPEGDPQILETDHCPLGVCSKKPAKSKKKSPKSSPKGSPKVSPMCSPRVSPLASPAKVSPSHTLPVPTVPLVTQDTEENPPRAATKSPDKSKSPSSPGTKDRNSIVVTTPPKENASPRLSPTGEPDDSLWSTELNLHNINLSNLKVTLVDNNKVYIEEHQDLSMGNQDELYESYTRRQTVQIPDYVCPQSLSAYLYHNGVLLLTAKKSDTQPTKT